MISINYIGNFGNKLFQYTFARVLAETNKLNLVTKFDSTHIINTVEHNVFSNDLQEHNKPTILISDTLYYNHRIHHGSQALILDPNYNYIVEGYFQDAEFFNNYEKLIKSFFYLPDFLPDKSHTLVQIRLGDFIHSGYNSEIIHYDWYNKAFNDMPGDKILFINRYKNRELPCTVEQEDLYISQLNQRNKIITGTGNKEDFDIFFKFDNIISSNSTWSWWGTFLSNSSNIVTLYETGSFGTVDVKSHGIHINNLWNIRNKSKPISGKFLDISKL